MSPFTRSLRDDRGFIAVMRLSQPVQHIGVPSAMPVGSRTSAAGANIASPGPASAFIVLAEYVDESVDGAPVYLLEIHGIYDAIVMTLRFRDRTFCAVTTAALRSYSARTE